MSLRHGPGAPGRRVFHISPAATIEAADGSGFSLLRRSEADSIQPENQAGPQRTSQLHQPDKQKKFPEQPAHGLLPNQLITLPKNRLDTRTTIGQRAQLVADARQMHIDTPVNTTLTDILQQLTDGTLPLDTYAQKPYKLLAAIPR